MRNKFPNISPVAPIDARKTTRGNLDNVANSLINLINFSGIKHPSTLSSAFIISYNRIQVNFNENPSACLNTLKLSRKWFVEYVRGDHMDNPGIKPWYWNHIDRVPIILEPLLTLLNSTDFESGSDRLFAIRIIIALLSLDRVMLIKGEPSYGTIVKSGANIDIKSPLYPVDITSLVSNLGFTPTDFKRRFDLEVSTFKYTVLSSAGVNGDATWTAHSDARALFLNPSVLGALKEYSELAHLDRIFTDLLSCISIDPDKGKRNDDLLVGRLHSFDEWGGKVRTVAIVDYWTQMLLTPLHNTINHFLSAIPMDGTFNQDNLAVKLAKWTNDPEMNVYSYDLTAATDRLPISLQVDILTTLLGSRRLALAWRNMLVERDYTSIDKKNYRYSVGQPMGARSSFPMLALTHHLIVQHAVKLASLKDYKDYVVLGDDMTITNSDVSTYYLGIMKTLDVPINLSKSVVHKDSPIKRAGEICKRIFIEGDEITSISTKLIAKTVRNGALAPTLQMDLFKRGVNLRSDLLTNFFFPMLDSSSFKDLMILNSIPSSVSGLTNPIKIDGLPIADLEKWFPGLADFNSKVVENVYTYTAAMEALKRLDGLLRQTLAIGVAISDRWGLYLDSPVNVKTLWEILGIPTDVSTDVIKRLSLNLVVLKPCHPIIRASESEIERITELLSGLISNDVNMYNRARSGLLDITRNALVDIWEDNDDARASGVRSLLNKTLVNLKAMIAKGTEFKENAPNVPIYHTDKMVLDYSIMLTQIQRHWNLRVSIKDPVSINAIKSRVTTSSAILSTQVNKTLTSISI